MALKKDTVNIEICPKCSNPHIYQIDVKWAYYMGLEMAEETTKIQKYFIRLFTCPKTGEDFQAKFLIAEPKHMRVDSVSVKGIVQESNTDENAK